jgi:hypothetical protein
MSSRNNKDSQNMEHNSPFANIDLRNRNIGGMLNYLYEFKDREVYKDYMGHRTKRLSFHTIFFFLLFITFYALPSQAASIIEDIRTGPSSPRFVPRIALSTLIFLLAILLFLSCAMIFWTKLRNLKGTSIISSEMDTITSNKYSYYYSTIFSCVSSLYFNMWFLRRSLSLSCESADSIFLLMSGNTYCFERNTSPFLWRRFFYLYQMYLSLLVFRIFRYE